MIVDQLPNEQSGNTASLEGLQRQLRESDYHILHFVGHGGFDGEGQEGRLLFEDSSGRGCAVSGDQLGVLLQDALSLRLVVLNACQGALAGADPFSGVARTP